MVEDRKRWDFSCWSSGVNIKGGMGIWPPPRARKKVKSYCLWNNISHLRYFSPLGDSKFVRNFESSLFYQHICYLPPFRLHWKNVLSELFWRKKLPLFCFKFSLPTFSHFANLGSLLLQQVIITSKSILKISDNLNIFSGRGARSVYLF